MLSQLLGRRIERQKNQSRVMDRPLALDGHHSMERLNNQPNIGSRGDSALEDKGGTGCYPIIWAIELNDRKNHKQKYTAAVDGQQTMNKHNKTTKNTQARLRRAGLDTQPSGDVREVQFHCFRGD
jgi:hypothetical protein